MAIRLGTVLIALLAAGTVYTWQRFFAAPPLPAIRDTWWGPGKARDLGSQVRPFKINIPDEVIKELHTRLDLWKPKTPPLEGVNFTYGFSSDYLNEVVQFWRVNYDWRKREAFLNSLPHFKTYISGLDLHFIHVKPKNVPVGTKVRPLLLLHGWPGSVREFYDVIPALTTTRKDRDFVFEVIAPSLPGFGFSEAASRPGLGPPQIAFVLKQLMIRVGYPKFYVQGGDWGGLVTSVLATLYPDNILGAHSNFCLVRTPLSELMKVIGSFYPSLLVEEPYISRLYPLGAGFAETILETGYLHIQATKPDTVGAVLLDSPAGLAAYMLEKFSTGTNKAYRNLPDGGLTKKFALTDLLDNVMIYYVTDSITTSLRLYAEGFSPKSDFGLNKISTRVPYACSNFPHEIWYLPRPILATKFRNLVYNSHPPKGGHFAAFEEPQLFVEEVYDGFAKIFESSTATSA